MKISVHTLIKAPMDSVWMAYTTPADILRWNAASDDWHTVRASVDLVEGGQFCSRMEAKDGSFGFAFEGTYTRIIPGQLIEYRFGERLAQVEFADTAVGISLRVTFDAEDSHSPEQQRQGWQAILDRFCRYVERRL